MLKWYEQECEKEQNIIASRVRFARNWNEYVFPSRLSEKDGREMVRRVGKLPAPMIGRKGDELMFEIDERSCTVHSHLLHAAIQNILRFLQIVDARIIAPSVGCKDK